MPYKKNTIITHYELFADIVDEGDSDNDYDDDDDDDDDDDGDDGDDADSCDDDLPRHYASRQAPDARPAAVQQRGAVGKLHYFTEAMHYFRC